MNRRLLGVVWPFAVAALLLAIIAVSTIGGAATNRARYHAPPIHPYLASRAPTAGTAVPDASKGGHYPGLRYPLYAVLIGTTAAVVLVLLGIWVALALGLFGFGSNVRPTRRTRAGPVENEVPDDAAGDARAAREMGRAVEASLADLDAGGDARRAVIACWVALERAAATAGTTRRESETPAELATRLLGAYDVNAASLRALADLYREARYSSHLVDDGMRQRARAALVRIRGELATPAASHA